MWTKGDFTTITEDQEIADLAMELAEEEADEVAMQERADEYYRQNPEHLKTVEK